MTKRLYMVLVWLVLGSAAAQRYTANLQFSSGGAFAAVGFSSQFEVSYNPIPELTVGAKVGLQAASLGGPMALRVNPYLIYRLLLASSETWFLTGYGGINAAYNSAAVGASVLAVLRPQKDGVEDDRPISPIPTPAGAGFQVLGLLGVDGAWFIDDINSAYFGFELDLQALPSVSLVVYPYLEYDRQILDSLTLALGGYLGLGSTFSYNLYAYAIYSLGNSSALRLEAGFTGQLTVAFRFILRG